MTWLVTGATGRVGTALVERLAGRVPLRLLVRSDGDPRARVAEHFAGSRGVLAGLEDGSIDAVAADIERADLGWTADVRAAAMHGASGVLHLAALTDFEESPDDRHRRVNVDGALFVARLAAAARVPLRLVSTAYVSGARRGVIREEDVDLATPRHNAYERSKAAAEHAVAEVARAAGIALSIFRLGVVLPDAPRAGLPTGPGPLVYLQFLAGLEGKASGGLHVVRHPGDVRANLNLVALENVVDVLADAVLRRDEYRGVYHVTAREPTSIGRLADLVNERIHDLRIELVATRTLRGGDRFERLLERHCRVYLPYLFTSARHDRTRLEREFGAIGAFAGPDDGDLRRIFTNHLDAWRAERRARPLPRECAEARSIGEYFGPFLGRRTGQRLVPGLESLSADFTVSVPSVGIYRLTIECGVLTSVTAADRPSTEIDYRGDAPSVLLAVEGRVRPADLFFQKRVTIAGNLPRALSTAIALEEFFRLHPFVASKSA